MKNKTMNLIYAVWAILLGAGGGIWLYILMGKYYNSATNDFGASYAALTPFKLFLALSVVLSAVIAVLIRKKTKNQIKTPNTVFFIAAVLFAVSGIASAVMILTKKPGASGIFAALTWLCILTELAVTVYFIIQSMRKGEKSDLLCLSLPLWSIFSVASSYFNPDFTYTNFLRTVQSLALAAMILFFLAYIREILGKKFYMLKVLSSAAALILGTSYISARLIYVLTHGGFLLSDALEISLIGALIFIAASVICEKKPDHDDADSEAEVQNQTEEE